MDNMAKGFMVGDKVLGIDVKSTRTDSKRDGKKSYTMLSKDSENYDVIRTVCPLSFYEKAKSEVMDAIREYLQDMINQDISPVERAVKHKVEIRANGLSLDRLMPKIKKGNLAFKIDGVVYTLKLQKSYPMVELYNQKMRELTNLGYGNFIEV